MFGCLKSVIKLAIVVLAVIGFIKIGGVDFVKEMSDKFQNKTPQEALIEKGKAIADFSKVGDEYELTRVEGMFGYKVLLAEHKNSGQKLAILETNKKELLTEEDFENEGINGKIDNIVARFARQNIRLKNFKLLDNGKVYTSPTKIKYVQFEAGVDGTPFDKIKGSIAAYKDDNNKNKILASANVTDQYSQKVTDDYFKRILK